MKRRGNIQNEPAFDPFPKAGLVKQFEPFIRKRAAQFCTAHPHLNREHVLIEAVKIALQAERAFKPGVASFPTYLIQRFRELHRLQDFEEKGRSSPIFRTAEDLAAEQA